MQTKHSCTAPFTPQNNLYKMILVALLAISRVIDGCQLKDVVIHVGILHLNPDLYDMWADGEIDQYVFIVFDAIIHFAME